MNAWRNARMAASSDGPFSHAKDKRSSASRLSNDRSPHTEHAVFTESVSNFAVSGERSHGYKPSFTAHLFLALARLPFFSNAISPSSGLIMRGMSASRTRNRAMNSALPPKRISVPRPAMFVAMVTAPLRPDCATISDSRSTFSGLALSNSYSIPSSSNNMAICSDRSTDVVPTSTGLPFLCMRAISLRTAFHLPVSERNTTSVESSRDTVRFVGTTCT
mmetsp:Transcript_2485/g.5420  ORF Transcript_2485/g.5420 Transcript_2485/m.5420 type:complete len:219 (+) Transcript_2485:1070-1726(+)